MFELIRNLLDVVSTIMLYTAFGMTALIPVGAVVLACNRKKFEKWMAKYETKPAEV